MSARDKYHSIVKEALVREGWLNQHDFRNILRQFSVRLIFFSVEGEEPLQWIETADIGKL